MTDALRKRFFSSLILIAVCAGSIRIDWLAGIMVTILTGLGLYEFFTMLEKKGIRIYKLLGLTIGVIIPLSILFRFESTKGWELLFIVVTLLLLFVMQFTRRDSAGTIVGISTTIFGILYVSWFMSFMIKLRYLDNGGLLASVIIITKLGDMGAYLVGSRFGKTPLIPRISPKKSVEGAIGGLIASVIGAYLSKPFLPFPLAHVAVIGLALGVIGQLGDLSESLMKRDCQMKDSAKVIPGIGGVLDLIDSLLFTVPAFYFYVSNTMK